MPSLDSSGKETGNRQAFTARNAGPFQTTEVILERHESAFRIHFANNKTLKIYAETM